MAETNGPPEGDQEPSPSGLSPQTAALVETVRQQSRIVLNQMSPEGQRSANELAAYIRAKYAEAGLDIADPATHAAVLLGHMFREEVMAAWEQQGIRQAEGDTQFFMALVQAGNEPGEAEPPQRGE